MKNRNTASTTCQSLFLMVVSATTALTCLPAYASESFDNFWLAPTAKQATHVNSVKGISVDSSWTEKTSDHYQSQKEFDQVFSSFISQETDSYGFSFATNYSQTSNTKEEYSIAMGARFGDFSLYSNSGSGDSYSRNSNAYHGLDPYAFHGGNTVDFSYSGAAVGYAVNNSDIQLGQTIVRARGLEDRKSSFVDFSNNRLFARYTHIERGAETVGYGIDLGLNFGNFNLGYQQIANRFDVSNKRIKLNWNKNSTNTFSFDLTQHENSRLEANSDVQGMITWHHAFGGNTFSSGLEKDNRKTKRSRSRRGILIGGAAAAGAILASSGNSSQDKAVRVVATPQTSTDSTNSLLTANISAQHEAARIKLDQVNPLSTAANKEYGGYVYQAADGSYAATEAVIGDNSSVGLPDKVSGVPVGTTARASYHTHAAYDPAFDSENFSEADIEGDKFDELDGYLATPSGAFKYHEVATGNITTLGSVSN